MANREIWFGAATAILLAAGLLALLVTTGGRPTGLEGEFLDRVEAGDLTGLLDLFHPALIRQVDPPILEMWLEAMNRELGGVEELLDGETDSSWTVAGSHRRIEWRGRIRFQHGLADVRLEEIQGRLTRFEVASERLQDWFVRPPGEPYRQRAEEFLRSLILGWEEDAFAEMHPNLQALLPLERLQAELAGIRGQLGELQRIVLLTESYSEAGGLPTLELDYRVEGSDRSARAPVQFQFDGLKGHLLGFHIALEDAGEAEPITRPPE